MPWTVTLGREQTQKSLLSVIADLLKDEHSDVRLNMVAHASPERALCTCAAPRKE